MLKNSLLKKYFALWSLCVIASIFILGVVLLMFFSRYFEQDKYTLLERNARQAAIVTANNYVSNSEESINKSVISLAFSILSSSTGADFFLSDLSGAIVYPDYPTEHNFDLAVDREIIAAALAQGVYEETGLLGGIFNKSHYTVAVPIEAGDSVIGILYASSTADTLVAFLADMIEIFLISAVVVLMISFVIIYFITSRLVSPLKDMLYATHCFSQGDFSKRVPVSGYDEIGQLSMAFNNMASTLSTTEITRRSFVANVSHELKTPMTTIAGFVDGILDGTIPPEKQDQYLKVVSNEVKRLSRLVRSMLDTARIEAGEMKFNPIQFDLAETLRQTVFTFERMIEEKNVEILGLDMDPMPVTADVDLMHQVVYNLVENAVKFVNESGSIEFFGRSDEATTSLAIRNSGEGLEKSEVPQLFERFYKSDKSRSLNKNGVGLGLHIVKNIINFHKGEVTVRSVEEQYTEFEFTIPTTAPTAEQK